jgi:hypothetical protein
MSKVAICMAHLAFMHCNFSPVPQICNTWLIRVLSV